jgi:hypothetical protein
MINLSDLVRYIYISSNINFLMCNSDVIYSFGLNMVIFHINSESTIR